ncbi:MAG TPA: hypothetical protein VF234_00075, partial [Limnochordia bacterium]
MDTLPRPDEQLPHTAPLAESGDFAARMVTGIGAFLDRLLDASDAAREFPQTAEAHQEFCRTRREQLRRVIGAIDPRLPVRDFELVGTTQTPSLLASTPSYAVHAVRWPVLEGVDGEGLLLRPHGPAAAHVIALPDADWSPEMLAGLAPGLTAGAQFARRLAECGCEVVVPVLIDRTATWSGNPAIRMTNQPHREFIYRMAFEMGRHIIGYEVQKVLALVDLFTTPDGRPIRPVGVCGYGEGGLLALHSAALDGRIQAVGVSGYFQNRRRVWQEPIYRNVWQLLQGLSDAELAVLIAPRTLVVEASPGPAIDGPPPPRDGRRGAAPGALAPVSAAEVQSEVRLARRTFAALGADDRLVFVEVSPDQPGPGSTPALTAFLGGLGLRGGPGEGSGHALASGSTDSSGSAPIGPREVPDLRPRLRRSFEQLCRFTQELMRQSAGRRQAFWQEADTASIDAWERTTERYRTYLWEEVIGRCPGPPLPANPRTRLVYRQPGWVGYEVMLDVLPDVFAYGLLLLPRDLKSGERRPVVVCQHGLEGRPQDVCTEKPDSPYHAFGARLAERGYVVYAPQNPYIGGDAFRVLQRKANPLGLSLFSFIVAQHQRTLAWLAEQPFVDPRKIAFYGLSYGGKTAMRVPALLKEYALSICSGDFNEWI